MRYPYLFYTLDPLAVSLSMPAVILSELYGKYGSTAKEVITEQTDKGIFIKSIRDLQIVNGGQTTASLFHTNKKDKAPIDHVFVQMKLSVVDEEKSEEVVPKISEYANTQNKVNAADFFSNHPFHTRMEEFSMRLWAPPYQGALRASKWFYERARGQYADAHCPQQPERSFRRNILRLRCLQKLILASLRMSGMISRPWFVSVLRRTLRNMQKGSVKSGKRTLTVSTNFITRVLLQGQSSSAALKSLYLLRTGIMATSARR